MQTAVIVDKAAVQEAQKDRAQGNKPGEVIVTGRKPESEASGLSQPSPCDPHLGAFQELLKSAPSFLEKMQHNIVNFGNGHPTKQKSVKKIACH